MFNTLIKGNLTEKWKREGAFNLYSLIDSKKINFNDSLQIDVKNLNASYQGQYSVSKTNFNGIGRYLNNSALYEGQFINGKFNG